MGRPPPPPPTPAGLRTVLQVALAGMLAVSWWLDHRPRADELTAPRAGRALGFRMEESARAAGLEFTHRAPRFDPAIGNIAPSVEALGAAVSVADVDGDGWADLYVTSSAEGSRNALFLNQGDGTFRDVAGQAGVADVNEPGQGVSMGSLFADLDNDGDQDMLLYKYGRPRLFRNERVPSGELRFTDVTDGSGIDAWRNGHAAVFLDYDRDGRLDLYLGGYFDERHDLQALQTSRIMQESFEFASNGGRNDLYRNLGGLRFEEVTGATGTDSRRWTMAAASADFDDDGWPDLYLANDYGPEQFFRNVEGRRFEELTDVGLGDDSKSGMAVAVGDVSNSGGLAVFVTNISKSGYLFQGNNLRLELLAERGRFLQVADGVVADCGWAWGAQFGDLDNDGFQDLFVVNGFISANPERDYWYPMSKVAGGVGDVFADARNWPPMEDASLSGYERSRVLLNRGGRGFVDVAAAVGVTDVYDGRAVAFADLGNRGALDVLVANQKGPLLLYRNAPDPARRWIALELAGTASNRDAIGATVRLTFAGADGPMTQVQVRGSSTGFSAQNDWRLHFGLGAATAADRVEVRWPAGGTTVLRDLPAGRLHRVEEPRDDARPAAPAAGAPDSDGRPR